MAGTTDSVGPGSFGVLLQRYRVLAGLSQEQLAERAGLSRRGISDLERGERRSPQPATVRRLADALNLGPSDRASLVAGIHPRAASDTSRGSRPNGMPRLVPAAGGGGQHNLPAPRVQLIGREQDKVAVRQLVLAAPGRLVTLTGAGGCGKTQLALLVASDLVEPFRDGVWFVDLAALQVPELMPNAVAAVLGRHDHAGQPLIDRILAYLRTRELLLVLDNCEHLIEACATFAERILSTCPQVRLLVTSRARLRVTGEVTWRVASLRSPDPLAELAPGDLLAYPAVRLFIERAQAVQPDFALTPSTAPAVASICARLEGLPLALELAAARTAVLSPAQILDRLDDSFRLLVGGSRTAPSRQQTLRATLDWSYGLLGRRELLVFARLAAFAGDWSLEAAETVCAAGEVAVSDVLDVLELLADKSLVLVEQQDGLSRYRLLEPVRQYAREQLVVSGEHELVRRRHAQYYVGYAEARDLETNRGGPRRHTATVELEREYSNIRSALAWCMETKQPQLGLRLAGSLLFLWQIQGATSEGLAWLGQFLALPGADAPTAARAGALAAVGGLALLPPDYTASQAACEEALRLARHLNEPVIEWRALLFSTVGATFTGDLDNAEAYGHQALACARTAGDALREGHTLLTLGVVARVRMDYAAAEALTAEALRLAHAERDAWHEAWALASSGHLALVHGAYQQAQEFLDSARVVVCQFGDPPELTGWILDGLGELAATAGQLQQARGWLLKSLQLRYDAGELDVLAVTLGRLAAVEGAAQPERALRLTGAAEGLYAALGMPRMELERQRLDRWLPAARNQLGTEVANRALAEGRALSVEGAMALARSSAAPHAPRDAYTRESEKNRGRLGCQFCLGCAF